MRVNGQNALQVNIVALRYESLINFLVNVWFLIAYLN